MESFFLCNGNETQEIVKPTGAHDFCFQRFIGMVCTRKLGISHLCLTPSPTPFSPNHDFLLFRTPAQSIRKYYPFSYIPH